MLEKKDIEEIKKSVNKGAENTLESLSIILNKKLKIVNTEILELKTEEIIQRIDSLDKMYGCIQVEIFGKSEIQKSKLGHFIIFMNEENTKKFVLLATKEEFSKIKHLDFFREIGNITSGSFLTSISEYFKFEFTESLPDFCYDMLGSCTDPIICSLAEKSLKNLVFKTVIKTQDDDLEMELLLIFYSDIYDLLNFKKEIE